MANANVTSASESLLEASSLLGLRNFVSNNTDKVDNELNKLRVLILSLGIFAKRFIKQMVGMSSMCEESTKFTKS